MTSEAVASKATQIPRQSRKLLLFETLLCVELEHLGLEPPLLFSQFLVLLSLLLNLPTIVSQTRPQGRGIIKSEAHCTMPRAQIRHGQLYGMYSSHSNGMEREGKATYQLHLVDGLRA
jgi:hypothetical protein